MRKTLSCILIWFSLFLVVRGQGFVPVTMELTDSVVILKKRSESVRINARLKFVNPSDGTSSSYFSKYAFTKVFAGSELFIDNSSFSISTDQQSSSPTGFKINMPSNGYIHKETDSEKIKPQYIDGLLADSIFFPFFDEYIHDMFITSDDTIVLEQLKREGYGIYYVIEDINHVPIEGLHLLISYKKMKDLIKNSGFMYVNKKMRIKYKNSTETRPDEILATYTQEEKENLIFYPLIGHYHPILSPGIYYIYFFYNNDNNYVIANGKSFNGFFESNKIKLIVK
ncbi:MAG: hypothetical protein J6X26_04275 [Bacteroidales bacterium]|nr:hypothetical protein [Bacteroidales bacterium]